MKQTKRNIKNDLNREVFELFKKNLHEISLKLEFGNVDNADISIVIASINALLNSSSDAWKNEGLKFLHRYPKLKKFIISNGEIASVET